MPSELVTGVRRTLLLLGLLLLFLAFLLLLALLLEGLAQGDDGRDVGDQLGIALQLQRLAELPGVLKLSVWPMA